MKKTLLCLLIIILGLAIWKKDVIVGFILQKVIYKNEIVIKQANEYEKKDQFQLLSETNSFVPSSSDDFKDIMYTILNKGWDSFSFYCDYEYKTCTDDFNEFVKNTYYLEAINNYVNPFNSYKNISVSTDNQITINIEKLYNKDQIMAINNKIDEFIKNNVNSSMSTKEKIKVFHDYIANNTKYDSAFNLNIDRNSYAYHPYLAYGPLFEGKAICSGYSDAMAIYLNKLGIPNYKISSDEHVWNYIYVDNNWYHLDLTWDDPVTKNHTDVLIYDFFLVSSNDLRSKNTNQHNYDTNYYLEAK